MLEERDYSVEVRKGKGITDELLLLTDAPKLARIIDNLFSNVYKYADISEPVTVTIEAKGSSVAAVIRNRVSQDNAQAESNKIGLKTCKKLAELLGIRFECGKSAVKGASYFSAVLEIPILRKDSE